MPVVGSNSGGINEILQNFAPEWTVNPDDSLEVAKTIIDVTKNYREQELLIKGQNWVENQCSLEHYALGMIQITGLS